jgi:hypothetical protein
VRRLLKLIEKQRVRALSDLFVSSSMGIGRNELEHGVPFAMDLFCREFSPGEAKDNMIDVRAIIRSHFHRLEGERWMALQSIN